MIVVKCEICGEILHTYPSLLKSGRGRFCSVNCKIIWSSTQMKGNKYSYKGGESKLICDICGKEFMIPPSKIKRGKGKFCSTKCHGVWRSKNLRGPNSPTWKGGNTPSYNIIRRSSEYYKWREKVFIRDNYTCQKCGDNIGKNLHAHHMKKYSVILNDIRGKYPLLPVTEIAINHLELWDIDNGVTLCKKCHKEKHKKESK